jgi:hypothetical protein
MLTEAPSGLDDIIRIFGNSNDPQFEADNIVLFTLPYPLLFDGKEVKRARCHRLLVDNFLKAFQDIKDAGLESEVKNFSGIFNKRTQKGGSRPSTHSWGIAIDLEAEKFPLGSSKRFSDEIVKIFTEAGFLYGGDFKGRKDPMHFQFATNF